ncbi:MAG: hypothetical protein IJF44_01875 [Clostridia bacterium]|nr:hypothetical protein [Clostridia bacterium]
MSEKNIDAFKNEGRNFLVKYSLNDLRVYAREIGVKSPTKETNKPELIERILAVSTGEIPAAEKSKRGKPVKNNKLNPDIVKGMECLCASYLGETTTAFGGENEYPKADMPAYDLANEIKKLRERNKGWYFSDSYAENGFDGPIEERVGQLATINSVSLLLPLDCIDSDEKVIISIEFIRQYDLRQGDVVSCYVRRRKGILIAVRMIKINGIRLEDLRRIHFDEGAVTYPNEPISFYEEGKFSKTEHKFFDWIAPVYKGQRALITGAPKSGKTKLLQELALAAHSLNEYVKVFVLLVDQSPETVNAFRKALPKDRLVYTTYEDESDRQVFAANFLLERAKRYAECGKDVLLVVDSLNALARAYNETEDSSGGKLLPCGLESKTVHFIKKYFGTGRRMERGGSLTILADISTSTGNPADDYLASELSALSNLKVALSDAMAFKHCYPALDPFAIQHEGNENGGKEKFLRDKILPVYEEAALRKKLDESASYKEFCSRIKDR